MPPDTALDLARTAFRRADHTLQNQRRDFPEWHLGRPRYALWALDVATPPVDRAVARAARHLDGLLLDGYARQPHITLALGGFPSPAPTHPDDYGPAAFDTQVAALRALAAAPFEIDIGGMASFTSAPFLTVGDDEGGIRRLHQALGGMHPGGPYTPHVTVGLYGGEWPTTEVLARLDSLTDAPPVRCRIERVSLMSYAAAEIGGPLAILADFHLADGSLHWHGEALYPPPTARAPTPAQP